MSRSAFGIDDYRISKAKDPTEDPSSVPVHVGQAATAGLGGATGYRMFRAAQNTKRAIYAAGKAEKKGAGDPVGHAYQAAAVRLQHNAALHGASGVRYGVATGVAGLTTARLAGHRSAKRQDAAAARRRVARASAARQRKATPATPVLAVAKAVDFSTDERRHLAEIGHARPGGRFPIPEGAKGVQAFHSAVKLIGHATETDRAYIRRRGEDLGQALPDSLKSKVRKYALPDDNPAAERARQRKKTGLGMAGVGYLAASRGKEVSPGAIALASPKPKNADEAAEAAHEVKVAARTKKLNMLSERGGAAMVGLGLAAAGEGLASDWRHRKVVQRGYKRAQKKVDQVRNRNKSPAPQPVLTKAYDPETSRHRRQNAYEGSATGGAVVSGAGAAYLGHKASQARGRVAGYRHDSEQAQDRLGAMLHQEGGVQAGSGGAKHYTGLHRVSGSPQTNAPAPPATPALAAAPEAKPRRQNWAKESARQKQAFASAAHEHENIRGLRGMVSGDTVRARRLGRGAVGAGATAVALGATAVGIHRHDKKGPGRSYPAYGF